jgi:hypothetical protein
VVGEMSELERRVLVLCDRLSESARVAIVEQALALSGTEILSTIDGIEAFGSLRYEDGILRASRLVSREAAKRVRASVLRFDALHAALALASQTEGVASDRFACMRLYIAANEESRALNLLHAEIGSIVREETADSILHELTPLRHSSRSPTLRAAIDTALDVVRGGVHGERQSTNDRASGSRPRSLPEVSAEFREAEYTLTSASALSATLNVAHNVDLTPEKRLTEAAAALFVAFNRGDAAAMSAAYKVVVAVRHAADVNPFDVHRADLMYHAFCGDRRQALNCAELLARESRVVRNIELACKGLRNAAEAMLAFGQGERAQSLLHESRALATNLGYHAQVVWSDMDLAAICIEGMDATGADAYLKSASERAARHSLSAPLLHSDLALYTCWSSLISGDFSRAQRAARTAERTYPGDLTGTALWAKLGVRLATHRGQITRSDERQFDELRSSIGTRAVHSIENFSLAALLLHSKQRGDHGDVTDYVKAQLPRIQANKGFAWPYILTNLA